MKDIKLATKQLATPRPRPERKFATALEEARALDSVSSAKGGFRKRVTAVKTFKSAEETKGAEDFDVICSMTPSDEQLAKINGFTRSPKTAEEVAAFHTLSCNDMLDRDTDAFTTQTVMEFAELGGALSSVGKSFMVGHDYSKMPIGRIFDVGVEKHQGATFLTNDVYIPRTASNEKLIEDFDYGINWAVSVGVMLDANLCSVCDSQMSRMGFCYDEGHMKGYSYEPGGEHDDWGWAEPVEEGTKGAVFCYGVMKGARDFYELSSVFLGAQYFAALDEEKGVLSGVLKAASAGGVPIVGLSEKEASELPLPSLPKQVHEAYEKYTVSTEEDGSLVWDDDTSIRWVFDPEEGEVKSLGRTTPNNKEAEDATTDTHELSSDESEGAEQRQPEQLLDGSGGSEERSPDAARSVSPDLGSSSPRGRDVPGSQPTELTTTLRAAGIPDEVLSAVSEEVGSEQYIQGVSKALKSFIDGLQGKAALGSAYLEKLTGDAINWYVRAHQSDGEPVSVDNFTKLIKLAGDDVELIESMIDEQRKIAQARFPKAVRRSSFEEDHNKEAADYEEEVDKQRSSKKISRLHG